MRGPLWQRQRRRRLIAITTAVLWLLAVEVLPSLHLAFHHHDHTHRHDGTIVWHSRGSQHDGHDHDALADHDHDALADHHHDALADHDHDALADHHHDAVADHDHDALGYDDHAALADHDDDALADHHHDALAHHDHDALAHHDHDAVAHHDHDALAHHDHDAVAHHDHDAVAHHDHDAVAHHDRAAVAHRTRDDVADDAHATGDAHDTDHPHGKRRKRSDRLAFDVVPTAHAATGIAHHALALLDPPPPLLAPVGAPQPERWSHAAPRTLVAPGFCSRPKARGPPTV